MKRRDAAMLILLTTASCADLSAVEEFAQHSSTIATNDPVISGWSRIYSDAERLAASPQVQAQAPDLQDRLRQEAAAANADVPLALEAGKTLGLYMQVLASLAGGNVPDVSLQAESISLSMSRLAANNPGAQNATSVLLRLVSLGLDAWREVTIRDLILRANPDVQTIANYLAATANAVAAGDKFVARVSDQYWEALGAASRDAAVRALVLRQERSDDAGFAVSITQAEAAQAAFKKIAADHAALARNAGNLSGPEVQSALSSDLPILLAAIRLFEHR